MTGLPFMRGIGFPAPRWSDLRTVDLDALAHRTATDEWDEYAIDPGPLLDALLAGVWAGARLAVGVFAVLAAAGAAVDKLRTRR